MLTAPTSSRYAWLKRQVRFHLPSLAIVLVACAIGQYATLAQNAPVPYPDTISYLLDAQAILTHANIFDVFRTPGYPGFLALLTLLTGGDGPAHVVAAQAALLSLTTFEVYALTFNLTRRRWIGVCAAVAFGTNLYLLDWERLTITEALSLSVCVTVYLVLECFLRTQRDLWLVALGAMFVLATMIRPTFLALPLVILGLLALRAARRGEWRRSWRKLGVVAVVVYLLVVGYMAGNWAVNGIFIFSGVSNVNVLGKVMEYQMQGENVNPRFAQLQVDLERYQSQHPGPPNPFYFITAYPQYGRSPFSEIGQYSDGIVARHAPQYVEQTIPDIVNSWLAQAQPYAPWTITSGWRGLLEDFSGLELEVYLLLPSLLAALALRFWRSPSANLPFVLLTMLVGALTNIVIIATASYDEFYRLRAPFDGVMLAACIIIVCSVGSQIVREWAVDGVGAQKVTGEGVQQL